MRIMCSLLRNKSSAMGRHISLVSQYERSYQKTTLVRCTAVWETGVSGHHGAPMEIPLESSVHLNTIILRCLKGAFNCSPMMTRERQICPPVFTARTSVLVDSSPRYGFWSGRCGSFTDINEPYSSPLLNLAAVTSRIPSGSNWRPPLNSSIQ